MYSIRKISLGTANFNQNYGVISNNRAFTLNKISKILKESKRLKIDTIDTSYTYGSVEKKLGNFIYMLKGKGSNLQEEVILKI